MQTGAGRITFAARRHSDFEAVSTTSPQGDEWAILDGYEDALRRWRRISKQTRAALRKAMGRAERRKRPQERRVLVLRQGETLRLPRPAEVRLEDGKVLRLERKLPPDVPPGNHTLRTLDGNSESHLIIHPDQCCLPKRGREWGWALQLYALRSRRSWGIGDLADLRKFARWSGRNLGTDFILLNPLGAPLPVLPQEASPYYPSSRLFLNPLYLRVEEVPGANETGRAMKHLAAAGRALNAQRRIKRDEVFRIKMRALEILFTRFSGHRALDRFRVEQGETLRRFAVFCVLAEHHRGSWRKWPARYRHPASPAVREFAAHHQRRIRFHEWLQWLLDEQLARAARELPLMLDLPIGVNPDGFDAWLWQDLLALDVSVGAPPDEFNALGQNWGLPPFIPHRLRASGYEPYRLTLRALLRHARGLRMDHVMGLFRLFWIPRGMTARHGGYVRYPADELLALLSLESQRAKAIVVGEDLGTVERGVRAKLRRHGLLSCRLLWFEHRRPERFPRQALAAVTTHDLFTIAGLWSGEDFDAQQRLGLHPSAAGMEAIRRRLSRGAGLNDTSSSREAILGAHCLLARTPCRLITATLDDALAVEERPNMPGTTTAWPNWSIALPKSLEEIQQAELVRKLGRIMSR
jgi:4-alpha-glucanotransferase